MEGGRKEKKREERRGQEEKRGRKKKKREKRKERETSSSYSARGGLTIKLIKSSINPILKREKERGSEWERERELE